MRARVRAAVLSVGAVLLSLGVALPAAAQVEMTGVRAMGLGEAFTGGPAGSGAIFHNPAGISALMMYAVEGSYVYDQETGRNLVHASIVDGKSNPRLGGAVGYTFSVSPEGANLSDFTGHDFYGSLATPIIPGVLILGATLHYLSYDFEDQDTAKGFTLDTGLLLGLGDNLSLGVAARDLISVEDSGRNRQLRSGVSYRSPQAHVGIDAIFDFRDGEIHSSVAGGVELMVLPVVPARVGYRYDGGPGHHILSGGFGWRSPTVGVDALFRQNLDEADHRMFGVALNLYL